VNIGSPILVANVAAVAQNSVPTSIARDPERQAERATIGFDRVEPDD
jgi:hypothetical protein